ncbi:hypothetical protein BJX63DRAFT_287630 [Aspergillus granulosus]|uniref:Uncharacterized protein n=1 Tax=Aspergillus granulosus TaxID=176169 RepID=A0ABR4H6V1_9EURO
MCARPKRADINNKRRESCAWENNIQEVPPGDWPLTGMGEEANSTLFRSGTSVNFFPPQLSIFIARFHSKNRIPPPPPSRKGNSSGDFLRRGLASAYRNFRSISIRKPPLGLFCSPIHPFLRLSVGRIDSSSRGCLAAVLFSLDGGAALNYQPLALSPPDEPIHLCFKEREKEGRRRVAAARSPAIRSEHSRFEARAWVHTGRNPSRLRPQHLPKSEKGSKQPFGIPRHQINLVMSIPGSPHPLFAFFALELLSAPLCVP